MIASLRGKMLVKSPIYSIVDVGGIGYKVFLSLRSLEKLPSLGQEVFLLIHTTVREDDISLFGFIEETEKRLFEKLISVSGIGSKLALTILSGIPPRELIEALRREDLLRLTAISGIGKKTAERMVLELKDKIVDLLAATPDMDTSPGSRGLLFEEALSALMNLGYQRAPAERTLARIPIQEGIPLESVIKQALRSLSGG